MTVLRCDICSLLIAPDDMRYTIMDDPENGVGRHGTCQSLNEAKLKSAMDRLPELRRRTQAIIDDLRGKIRR